MRYGARCTGRKARELGRGAAAGANGPHAEDPRLRGWGGTARAGERTRNIWPMSVTRDVSKLTGWLKAFASCQVEKAGLAIRVEVRRPERGGPTRARGAVAGASGVHVEDPRQKGCGGRARAAERTKNMPYMSMTPEVSKLTGWLKAFASCRVESRACVTGRGAGRVIGRLGADTGGQESGRNAQEECGLWFQEARIAHKTWLSWS